MRVHAVFMWTKKNRRMLRDFRYTHRGKEFIVNEKKRNANRRKGKKLR